MPQEIVMADAKVAAFLKEFPFLEPHIRKTGLLQCQVKRVDQELLGKIIHPNYSYWFFCFFFDKDGNLLAKPGVVEYQANVAFFGTKMEKKEESKLETIFDCLQRIGDTAKKVHFIVTYKQHCASELSQLCVYKPPKTLSVVEFMEAGMLVAQDQLAQQIKIVDGAITEAPKFCIECGCTLPPAAKFCQRCGRKLT